MSVRHMSVTHENLYSLRGLMNTIKWLLNITVNNDTDMSVRFLTELSVRPLLMVYIYLMNVHEKLKATGIINMECQISVRCLNEYA